MATEIMTDKELGTVVLNDSEIATNDVMKFLGEQEPELAALVRWSTGTQQVGRHGGLFERDRYVTPETLFDEFKVAYDAAEHDDVVSGVLETTEALAFGKMSLDCQDPDETDIWNQIAADLDLDSRLREMWRELFIVSQFYAAVWWGRKTYKVRGKSGAGVKRKKEFRNLYVPRGITILDPTKVIPVGSFMFNREQLAYVADKIEGDEIDQVLNRTKSDPVIEQLISGPYNPSREEMKRLAEFGVGSMDRLFMMNPKNVFRHTATRPQYKKMATVRLKSVFELLDMKHQLRQMDRAHLIGGTNFIVLVKKGSDAMPAKPAEIANLQAQVRTVARVPVLVGDHRLEVEIITPKLDTTLQPEKYNGLDARITARLYQMFMTGNFSAGAKGDDSIKLARVVARAMESRRHMLRRSLEFFVFKPAFEANDDLIAEQPKLLFHPKRIALDFDPALANYLLDLRDRGDISRQSILEEVGYNEDDEARRREREANEGLDDIFTPTNVPFDGAPAPGQPGKPGAPNDNTPKGAVRPPGAPKRPGAKNLVPPVDPKAQGRTKGGNRNGGGSAPGTGQGKPATDPRRKSK